MCGIVGIWNLDRSPLDKEELDRFTDSLAHRGPDGRGTYFDSATKLGLGHRRLSILDISAAGDQPMSYANKRYWIVYNGEVYNFLELRKELVGLGYTFSSQSDTEVVLASFIEWGEECQYKFNGMWAFAIWDTQERTLFISRDRFGVKPLYYFFNRKHFIFCSELKAFMALNSPKRPDFDLGIVALFSNLESVEKTILDGVRILNAGCFLILKFGGSPRIKRWWNTNNHLVDVPKTFDDQVAQYKELFFDACKIRMRSDVPIGTALSGGLDSSSVLSTMAKIRSSSGGERLASDWQKSFFLDYTDTSHSEKDHVDTVIRHTGVTPFIKQLHQSSISLDDLVSAIFSLEAIQNQESHIGPWLIYREMRRNGVSVSIDGHGGDESIAGYHHHVRAALEDNFWPWKIERWDTIKEILEGLYSEDIEEGSNTNIPSRSEVLNTMLSKFLDSSNLISYVQRYPDTYEFLRSIYENYFRSHRTSGSSNWVTHRKSDPLAVTMSQLSKSSFDSVNRSLYIDFHYNSLPTILRNFDRDSMAHGVEIRAPFLDWRLVSYAFSLPSNAKLGKGFTKRILRESMRRVLPEDTRIRKSKMGFSSPMIEWYKGALRTFVLDSINSTEFLHSEIWNGPLIRDYVEKCYRNSDYRNATKSWKFIQAMILMRSFLEISRNHPIIYNDRAKT